MFPNLRNYNGDGEKNKGCGESLIQIQLGDHFLLLFAPTPDCGQRLAEAVGEPFIPVEEKSRRIRFNEWPPKGTTWLTFRCYQVGK